MKNLNLTSRPKRDSKDDTMFTPANAVHVFLKSEKFEGKGWEPASGCGNISKCFSPPLMSSDISTAEWVYGEKGVDFLKTYREVDFIITNPPFVLAMDFAKHALKCANKVAMLLRVQFLESNKRLQFFQDNPPKTVYVYSGRVKCYSPSYKGSGKGIGSQTLAWFVWEKGFRGNPTIKWLKY